MAKDATQPRRQRSFVWLQGLLCGALATLATPTALLLGVLLAPRFARDRVGPGCWPAAGAQHRLVQYGRIRGTVADTLDLGSHSVHSDNIAGRSMGGWDSMERRSRGLAADRNDAARSAH